MDLQQPIELGRTSSCGVHSLVCVIPNVSFYLYFFQEAYWLVLLFVSVIS